MSFFTVDPLASLLEDSWTWLNELSFGTILVRIFTAIICGGLLGVERAKKHHAAGFRTYILVCLGASIAMLTNQFIFEECGHSGDIGRLGAQVISGIGFLGAGTILVTSRNQIKGLTTAAGLWACGCLGLACGAGFYTLALFGAVIIIVVLSILPTIEKTITAKSNRFQIHIEFDCRANLKEFVGYVRNNAFKIISIEHNPAYSSSGLSVYTIELINLDTKRKKPHFEFINEFASLSYVNHVEEIL